MDWDAYDSSIEHVVVDLPEKVRRRASEWTEEQDTSIQDHLLEAERGLRATGANDLYNDYCCGWALSSWMSEAGVWQDCSYFDGLGVDLVVDDKAMGLLPVVICHTIEMGTYKPVHNGIRISNRRLVKNNIDSLYVHCSINGDRVTFHGLTIIDQIMAVENIIRTRPLIYHLPIAAIKVKMGYFITQCRKSKKKQEVFEGLFKEK
jgi:hypothetical protein